MEETYDFRHGPLGDDRVALVGGVAAKDRSLTDSQNACMFFRNEDNAAHRCLVDVADRDALFRAIALTARESPILCLPPHGSGVHHL